MSRRVNCSRCGKDLIGHAKFCVKCANDFELSPLEKAAPDLLNACEASETILRDIASRHISHSFHNNRIHSDSYEAINILKAARAKAKKG